MDFETIPGVDEKTTAVFAEFDDAERTLTDGDATALARAPGLTEGRAATIACGAIRRNCDDLDDFLTTDRTSEIYRDVLGLL